MKFLNTNNCIGVALSESDFVLLEVIARMSATCDDVVVPVSLLYDEPQALNALLAIYVSV